MTSLHRLRDQVHTLSANEIAEHVDQLPMGILASHSSFALEVSRVIIRRFTPESDTSADMDALLGLAVGQRLRCMALVLLGRREDVLSFTEEALSLHRQLGLKRECGMLYRLRAIAEYEQGRFREALEDLQVSLKLADEVGDQSLASRVLQNIGNTYAELGDTERAMQAYHESLRKSVDLNPDQRAILTVTAYNNIGGLHNDMGQYEQAIPLFERGIDECDEVLDPMNLARLHANLGVSLQHLGRYEEAEVALKRSMEIRRYLNDAPGEAFCLKNLGIIAMDRGQCEESIQLFEAGLEVARRANYPKWEMDCHCHLAEILSDPANPHSDLERALREVEKSLLIWKQHSVSVEWSYKLHRVHAKVLEARGEMGEALRAYRTYVEQKEALYNERSKKQIDYLRVAFDVERTEKEAEIHRLKNIELERLNREKDEFLGIAAHDLKNPLSAIQGFSQLLLEGHPENPEDEMLESLTFIEKSATTMFDIVTNLLDLNRLDNPAVMIEMRPCDAMEIIDRIVDDYVDRVEQKGLTLRVERPRENVRVMAESKFLHQVLDNLISNAIKYSPQGKLIRVHFKEVGLMQEISVEDEGPGIHPEDRGRLFKRFARLRSRPTGGEHSSGLGLAIVKRLIELMEGDVGCESELGKGSRFWVRLPLATGEDSKKNREPAQAAGLASKMGR